MSITKKLLLFGMGLSLIILLAFSGKMIENVDNGEIVIIQSAFDGEITICDHAGPVMQNFGTATHYKKSNQFWFSKHKEEGDGNDQSVKIRFNDGGHGTLSGSVRWYMPSDHAGILKLHTDFGSQDAIEQQLIRQVLTKSIYMSGPLMSSKESSAEKRNDLLSLIEDQAIYGVYKTAQKDIRVKDELSGMEKSVTIVSIVTKDGTPVRQEKSPLGIYYVTMSGLTINSIDYDANVEKQIQSQQNAYMLVQTSIANAKKAEQDAITAEQNGKAAAMKAKWDQEVIKAQVLTAAEQEFEKQKLLTKTAELYKQQQILEGQGDAEKKRLMMNANGALEQKLETWLKSQQAWAKAFAEYKGSIVPQIQTGGVNGTKNGAVDFMELMGYKAAKDLSLDMSNTK